MWKVCGIKIERTRAPNFFCRRTRKSVRNRICLLFGQLLGNEERYWDGSEKVKWWLCIRDQTPCWRKLAAEQFWLCFDHPKSVEGDKSDPLVKIWGVTKNCISRNFRNRACPLKQFLHMVENCGRHSFLLHLNVGDFFLKGGSTSAPCNSASKTPYPILSYIFWTACAWTWRFAR